MECVTNIEWENIMKEKQKDIVRDCHSCDWYKNMVCKGKAPCLMERLQILSDAIEDMISKQIELEEKQDKIIRGLQGKMEAEYKKNGGGL